MQPTSAGGAQRNSGLERLICTGLAGHPCDPPTEGTGKWSFKGGAKAFVRTYAFLSSVLPYINAEWEKHSTS